jgi:hypothetical protein
VCAFLFLNLIGEQKSIAHCFQSDSNHVIHVHIFFLFIDCPTNKISLESFWREYSIRVHYLRVSSWLWLKNCNDRRICDHAWIRIKNKKNKKKENVGSGYVFLLFSDSGCYSHFPLAKCEPIWSTLAISHSL